VLLEAFVANGNNPENFLVPSVNFDRFSTFLGKMRALGNRIPRGGTRHFSPVVRAATVLPESNNRQDSHEADTDLTFLC
jgi:hypothetical protein